jgi:hypothetical protein
MRKLVGTYRNGGRNVRLFWRRGEGGSFIVAPTKRLPEITVGIDGQFWEDVVGWLIHEAAEMAAYDLSCRWTPSPDFSYESSGYLFVMNHNQFSDVLARAAMFISKALPDLAKIYKKQRRPA